MATKKYVDLDGLAKFQKGLKDALADNTATGKYKSYVVAQATNAKYAVYAATADGTTKETTDIPSTYLKIATASSTYVPLTRKISNSLEKDKGQYSVTLANDLTALDFQKILANSVEGNLELGAQVNKLEGVQFKGSRGTDFTDLTIDENKKVQIDLSAYALISDVTAALHFRGVVNYEKDLPASGNQVGDVYIVRYRGTSGKESWNMEFVWCGDAYVLTKDEDIVAGKTYYTYNSETKVFTPVTSPKKEDLKNYFEKVDAHWEKFGDALDLENYYTKEEVNALIEAEATERKGADTTLQGNIDAEASTRATNDATLQSNIDAIYKYDEKATPTESGKLIEKTDAIMKRTGSGTEEDPFVYSGYAKTYTDDKIDALDKKSGRAEEGKNYYYVIDVTEENGVITQTYEAKGAVVAAPTTGTNEGVRLVDGNTVHAFVTEQIGGLNYTSEGAAGSYIQKVSEASGVIDEVVVAFDTALVVKLAATADTTATAGKKYYSISGTVAELATVPEGGNPKELGLYEESASGSIYTTAAAGSNDNAPTSKAAYDCSKAFYDDIGSVALTGKTDSIESLFPEES